VFLVDAPTMPTRRVSRGGLTGQLSINDELLNQLLQGGKAASKSFSVRQFAEMFEEHTGSGGPAVGTAAAQKVPSASEALGTAGASEPGRSRSRRGSANPTTSSGSGKTSEEIWKNIQLTGAESLQGPPSILSTPQGSGALGSGGGGLGLGGMGTLTGRLSIPTGSMLFPQKSIDRLVEQHGAGAGGKTVNRPASEWMDMMMATLPSGVPKGMQPTPSARFALETAAAEIASGVDTNGARAKTKRGPSNLGGGATGKSAVVTGTASGKKRGRQVEDKPVFTPLPPKKKGRKKKGEVDTETEEEKAQRAEERQRKNRESAARSHKRKAELAGDLENRVSQAERRALVAEKEVAKLKAEIAVLKKRK
jgi:hypothetical protein